MCIRDGRKIRSGLGLDKSRCNVSGAAPIPTETKDWFGRLGIPISEAYGMTENGATSHMITAQENKPGSVGRPQNGTEHRIEPDTQEVLTRSPYTMLGYYKSPGKTAETIDKDGWLHTGDIGHIDEAGRVAITDRKKDLIVNDKGDNIAPQKVEGMLTIQPEILQAMIAGDRKPYMVGLIVPDPEWALEWSREQGVP